MHCKLGNLWSRKCCPRHLRETQKQSQRAPSDLDSKELHHHPIVRGTKKYNTYQNITKSIAPCLWLVPAHVQKRLTLTWQERQRICCAGSSNVAEATRQPGTCGRIERDLAWKMPDEPLKSLHTSQWHTHPAYLVKNSKSSEIWFPCWDCSPLSVIIWSVWHVTIHDLDPHHWSHNAPLHSQALRWSSVVLSRQNISWVNKCSTRGSPPTCTLVHFPVCSHLETCHPSHHPASGYSPTKLVKGTTNNQEQEATKTRIVRQLLDFERFWVFRVECGGWTYAPNKLQLPWSAWSFTLEDQNFSPEKCFDQGSVMYLLIFHDSMLHACLAMMFPLIPFVLCLKELCSAASGWVSPQSPWGATGTCRDQVMGVAWSQLKFDTRTIWQKLKYMSKMPDWGRPCGFQSWTQQSKQVSFENKKLRKVDKLKSACLQTQTRLVCDFRPNRK